VISGVRELKNRIKIALRSLKKEREEQIHEKVSTLLGKIAQTLMIRGI
jgi:hypothetical protein